MNNSTIFYYGNTVVKAGETVVVRGEWLDTLKGVSVSDGNVSCEAEILQLNRQSFKVIIPNDLSKEGNYWLTLRFGEEEKIISLNKPKIRWTQGDEGPLATADGWLRVNGEKLSITKDAQPYAEVKNKATGEQYKLVPSRIYDAYSVRFDFNGVGNGEYELKYFNGYDYDVTDCVIGASPMESWNKTVYNVLDYGLVDNPRQDSTAALRNLLKIVEKNGGGIVYFPKGRYLLSEGLISLPPKVILKGDGVNKTQISWNDVWFTAEGELSGATNVSWSPTKLPDYMFTSNGSLKIEGIYFRARRIGMFLRAGTRENPANDIYIENIYIYQNSWEGSYLHYRGNGTVFDNIRARSEVMAESTRLNTNIFRLFGDNIHIGNTEIMCSGMPFCNESRLSNLHYHDVRVRGETAIEDWAAIGFVKNAIIEDMEFSRWTVGVAGSNVYFSRNKILDSIDNNREGFTSDIDEAIFYFGEVKGSGKEIIFPQEVDMRRTAPGYKVCILEGTGAGQYRTIEKIQGRTLILDEPFEVAPDETSKLTVNDLLVNWFMCDNYMVNSASFQFYVPQYNLVVDGTMLVRSGALSTYAAVVPHPEVGARYSIIDSERGKAHTMWYVSFINNCLKDGDDVFRDLERSRCELRINTHGNVLLNICTAIRKNRLCNEAIIYCKDRALNDSVTEDLIIEENYIEDSRYGIMAVGEFKNSVFRENTFQNVETEMVVKEADEHGGW